MQRLIYALATLALACGAGAASHAADAFALRWLADHHQMPGAADLSELKSVNPDAFAIVQALLTKQSMGLIKRSHHGGGIPDMPDTPDLEVPQHPAPAVVAQGYPTTMGTGPAAPAELPEILPQEPTAPPAMPPPPPISPPLPPALDEASEAEEVAHSPIPAPAPALVPVESPALPVRLSAMGTRSSMSSGSNGGGFGLNWSPDRMMADNERMVSNVLGAVAQLKGVHVKRGEAAHGVTSPLSQESLPDVQPEQYTAPQPVVREVGNKPTPGQAMIANNERMVANVLGAVAQLRDARANRAVEVATNHDSPLPQESLPDVQTEQASHRPMAKEAAQPVPSRSAADLYLASTAPMPSDTRPAQHHAEPSDDDVASHLPGDVSWNNPYTYTASANADLTRPRTENSYLKGVDFGIPQVQLPPKRSDDANPYLQGLDLTGSSVQSAPTGISASALTAVHQDQLLSSHTILYEHDLEFANGRPQASLVKKTNVVKAKKKDVLSGFLAPAKSEQPRSPSASLVNKNAYLAKLGETTAVASSASSASSLASNIEQDNPYLMALDDAPATVQPSVAAEPVEIHPAMPKRDANRPQLSMASSKKATSKTVTQKVVEKKKNVHALSDWMGGAASEQVPDQKVQRLKEAVALRVADARNPYLNGLDMTNGANKAQAAEGDSNPYMASFDQ